MTIFVFVAIKKSITEPKTIDRRDIGIPKYPKVMAEIKRTGVTIPTKDIQRIEIIIKIIVNW